MPKLHRLLPANRLLIDFLALQSSTYDIRVAYETIIARDRGQRDQIESSKATLKFTSSTAHDRARHCRGNLKSSLLQPGGALVIRPPF